MKSCLSDIQPAACVSNAMCKGGFNLKKEVRIKWLKIEKREQVLKNVGGFNGSFTRMDSYKRVLVNMPDTMHLGSWSQCDCNDRFKMLFFSSIQTQTLNSQSILISWIAADRSIETVDIYHIDLASQPLAVFAYHAGQACAEPTHQTAVAD